MITSIMLNAIVAASRCGSATSCCSRTARRPGRRSRRAPSSRSSASAAAPRTPSIVLAVAAVAAAVVAALAHDVGPGAARGRPRSRRRRARPASPSAASRSSRCSRPARSPGSRRRTSCWATSTRSRRASAAASGFLGISAALLGRGASDRHRRRVAACSASCRPAGSPSRDQVPKELTEMLQGVVVLAVACRGAVRAARRCGEPQARSRRDRRDVHDRVRRAGDPASPCRTCSRRSAAR